MKKKLYVIWAIAIFTVLGITLFQAYWLSYTIKLSHQNFLRSASTALQQSINDYQLKQSTELTHPRTSDSTFSLYIDPSTSQKRSAIADKSWKRYKPDISTANRQQVQIVLSRMISQVLRRPVNLKELKPIYLNNLKKAGISLPFSLIYDKSGGEPSESEITGVLSYAEKGDVIHALFDIPEFFFLRLNIIPLAVSLALVILTLCCLLYMGKTIRDQVSLDQLKSNFISNMTHEFRTPVAILKSTHEALNEYGQLSNPEKTLRYIKANQLVLHKLEKNIDRMLEIMQFENGLKKTKIEQVNLKSLINDLLFRFNLSNSDEVVFHFDLPVDDVFTDSFMMDAILSNLLDNAIKYTSPPRLIKIDVHPIETSYQITITDNGLGIPANQLPYIFDRFFRVSMGDVHDVKGYGLGLSYVKELIGLLNGRIYAESKPGIRTTIRLKFPLNE